MIIGWHKSIVSSDWSDTMMDIAVTFFYHPIYMIIGWNSFEIILYRAASVVTMICSDHWAELSCDQLENESKLTVSIILGEEIS